MEQEITRCWHRINANPTGLLPVYMQQCGRLVPFCDRQPESKYLVGRFRPLVDFNQFRADVFATWQRMVA